MGRAGVLRACSDPELINFPLLVRIGRNGLSPQMGMRTVSLHNIQFVPEFRMRGVS